MIFHLAPLGLARANPLPLLPVPVPRTDPRLTVPVVFSPPPRLLNAELGRDVAPGVVYLDEAVGRLEM